MKKMFFLLCIILLLSFFASFIQAKETSKKGGLTITSPAFKNNEMIQEKFTCDGANVNPLLLISNMPPSTKSFALIVDDPDAPMGIWVHWVVWNIPPDTKEIAEDHLPTGARQGLNDFRKNRYGGPCPPSGTHRYFFKLYALDSLLDLPLNATKSDLEKAMKGHVLGHAEIVGLYRRR